MPLHSGSDRGRPSTAIKLALRSGRAGAPKLLSGTPHAFRRRSQVARVQAFLGRLLIRPDVRTWAAPDHARGDRLALPPNSIRSRCISTRRPRARPWLGGLGASGWQACCILMRMCADGLRAQFQFDGRARRRRGQVAASDPAGRSAHGCAPPCSKRAPPEPAGHGASCGSCFELFNACGERVMTLDHVADDGPAQRAGAAVMRYFEDIHVGDRWSSAATRSPPTASRPSRARFDPQPFHLDEAAAARSPFGALCASGWHTVAVWMRLLVDHGSAGTTRCARARRAGGRAWARRPASAI